MRAPNTYVVALAGSGLDEVSEAVAAYRRAGAVEPEHVKAAANLARLEPSAGFPEEAEESGVAVAEDVPSVESTEPEDGTE